MGVSTIFTRLREKYRLWPAWIRWPVLMWQMVKSIFIYPSMAVSVSIKGKTHHYRTRSVSVSNNLLSGSSIVLPARERMDQGCLGVYVASDNSVWSLPVLVFKLLIGTWIYDTNLICHTASDVVIRPRYKRRIRVMMDGELYRLKGPLKFSVRPGGVCLLAPSNRAGRADRAVG